MTSRQTSLANTERKEEEKLYLRQALQRKRIHAKNYRKSYYQSGKQNDRPATNDEENETKGTILLPYIRGEIVQIIGVTQKFVMRTVFNAGENFETFFGSPKDKIPEIRITRVYGIPWSYGKSYLEQTEDLFKHDSTNVFKIWVTNERKIINRSTCLTK